MRLPRDVSGAQLVKSLAKLGCHGRLRRMTRNDHAYAA